MNQLKNRIDTLYSQHANYIIIFDRKRKNKFIIRDGFMNYVVSIGNEIMCQCNKFMCNHVLYLLHSHFKLSDFSIYYMTFSRYHKLLILDMHNGNEFIENKIIKNIIETECGICYLHLNMKDLYVCDNCCNMVHDSCMRKWITAQKNQKRCIYCNS